MALTNSTHKSTFNTKVLIDMFKIWLQLSIRRFWRNKVNSLINLLGLSLGMLVFILIFIYVRHELSYDTFHNDSDRIFRLLRQTPPTESTPSASLQAVLPGPLYDVLKNDMGGIEAAARIIVQGGLTIEVNGKTFTEDKFYPVDQDIFNILTFDLVSGSPQAILSQPNTIAVSESTALKYFGSEKNALGETVDIMWFKPLGQFTISGVYKDMPSNSSYQFNLMMRLDDYVKLVQPGDLENWGNNNYGFLIKINDGVSSTSIEQQTKQFFTKKYEGTQDIRALADYPLEPIQDMYLRQGPVVNFSLTPTNDRNRVYLLGTIAALVMLIATINYINLTTARAVSRAKEVGIRKISGAFQSQLIGQFLLDSMVIAITSFAVAISAAGLMINWFRDFVGKPIPFDLTHHNFTIYLAGVIVIGIGVLAGLYPAFVLSSFKPAQVLKGNYARSSEGSWLRTTLTIFQFTISGILLISVFVIARQLRFIETNDPGYAREQIVTLNLFDEGVRAKQNVLVEELKKYPNIKKVSVASYLPNSVNTQQGRKWRSNEGTYDVSFFTSHVDENYIELFEIELIEGRNFSSEIASDKNAFIVNETAVKTYDWENPVGMTFTGEMGDGLTGDTVHIIGVMKDIHFVSYRNAIKPLRFGWKNAWTSQIAIKVNPTDLPATLSYIEKNYKKLATTKLPYSFNFFDEQFGRAYKSDQQLSKLIIIFSSIAVLISCLGMYGLSLHSVTTRLKEVGVRKVLGASAQHLTLLLSNRFMVMVLIAFCASAPIAYYVMDQWLSGFAYHTQIGVETFIITAVTMASVCLVTVSAQVWSTVNVNPVNVLRSE